MKAGLATFASGLLFALGLGVSGMTIPSRVIQFLDVTGDWDPSLALVMASAVGVNFAFSLLFKTRTEPLFAGQFHLAEKSFVDARLIIGAALFGAGWGLGGFCPGPALTSLVSGQWEPLTFVVGMVFGMLAFSAYDTWTRKRTLRNVASTGEAPS